MLYGPAIRQSDCRKAGPYQLPSNNSRYDTNNPVNKQFITWQKRKYPNIDRQFVDNAPKKIFFAKLVQNHFPKVFRKFSDNSPRILRKNRSRVLLKTFPECYSFPKFSENLLNMRYQFCLAAESIRQDGAILPR